jgi:succinylarginine dihydrolase
VSSNTLSWLGNTATVSVDDPDSATRTYHLSTTANLRDNIPQSKQITEADGQMRLRSALFAESDVLELRALPYRGHTIDISVHLPAAGSDTTGYYDINLLFYL